MKKYMIVLRNIFKRYYWSNQYGWADQKNADRFTEEETKKYNLPAGGQWSRIN